MAVPSPDYAPLARKTLPGLLLERAHRTPDAVALRAKVRGIYAETSWRALADRVAAMALAFEKRTRPEPRRIPKGRSSCTAPTSWDLADEVTVLDFGQRIAAGPPATVLRDPRVIDAYLGADFVPRSKGDRPV